MNTQEKLQMNALALENQRLTVQCAQLTGELLVRERAELEKAQAAEKEAAPSEVVASALGVDAGRVQVEGVVA